MNWLLVIILIVVALSAVIGYYRGFVRTVLSMVFLILVMILSGWISPYIGNALEEHTQITETIRSACTELLEDALNGQVQTTGEDVQEQENYLASLGLPSDLFHGVMNDENLQNVQQQQTESVAAAAADYLTGLAVNGIVFVASFLLAWIIVRILMRIADAFAELPVIGFFNRICGGLVGILRGLLWVWIFFIILTIFVGTGWGRSCMQAVREDLFLSFLYDNNLILRVLLYAFT